MFRFLTILFACILSVNSSSAQVYGKLNGLYALGGVINPAIEIGLSEHSTFQTELVVSPWKSIRTGGVDRPMTFGIFLNEYRYYFKQRNHGWYLGANGGMMAFNMTKPDFSGGSVGWKNNSSKGYGLMFGVTGGYEWIFNDKWMLDVYFGFAYMMSKYNGYSLVDGLVDGGHVYNRGEIIMTPHRAEQPEHPDPFNGSAEWLPNKIGVSFGILLFDPAKHRR